MRQDRSHWYGAHRGAAVRGDPARIGGMRGSAGPFRPSPIPVHSPARGSRPARLRWSWLPALAFLVFLGGSGAAAHAAPEPMIEAIQRALVERGFEPGKIDGAMGSRTRDALRAFQRSIGLPDTGRADDATLAALGLKVAGRTPPEADNGESPAGMPPEPETPSADPAGEPGTDVPQTEAPGPEPPPSTETPKRGAQSAEPAGDEAGTGAAESKPPRDEPAPEPNADPPEPDTSRADPEAVPNTGTSAAEPRRAEPVRKPDAEPTLRFAALGWHRPQTGEEALTRFTALGAPPDFKRDTGSLFVPRTDHVFVLKPRERVPGFDCDPGAGRLAVEFVFGPDGPVIFDPVPGGEYCRMGIGIALEVGGILEMRRIDWGDVRFPSGTVRITHEGLEYIR